MRFILLLLCLQPALLSAAPRVVVSIAPLQEIAAALMAGIGNPETVIEEQASAHHFALRPSHMALLQRADLVIWVDRHFESGFNRVPAILPDSTARLELLPAIGSDDGDGHFWYSPELLQRSIGVISAALIRLDPEHRAQYLANAQQLEQAIEAWRERVYRRWQAGAPRILTAHDFLRPFAADFGLFEIEAIYDRHDAQGGLQDLRRLEDWLRAAPAACLLTLERHLPALAERLADKYGLRVIRVANGAPTAAGDAAILGRLARLDDALLRCAAEN